ncbi:hypothetical protein D3C84_1303860 [compost metagenome]
MLAHLVGVVVGVEGVKRPLATAAHAILAGLNQRFQFIACGLFVGLGLCGSRVQVI